MEKRENKRSLCDATELATSRSRKRETDRIRKKKKKAGSKVWRVVKNQEDA